MRKKIVGIAMGGYSSEREISLKSGNEVYNNISKNKWIIYKLIINQNNWLVIDENQNEFFFNRNDFSFSIGQRTLYFDIIFNSIHGIPGENGELAGMLKFHNIPHTSCDQNEAELTFNKIKCLKSAKKIGISTAKSISFKKGDKFDLKSITNNVSLPCFVKPNSSGSSFGVVKVYKKKAMSEAIETALKEDSEILIEENLLGSEVSVGVYSKKGKLIVLPPTEIISKNDFFDYQAKYEGKCDEITPANLDSIEIEKLTEASVKLYTNLKIVIY